MLLFALASSASNSLIRAVYLARTKSIARPNQLNVLKVGQHLGTRCGLYCVAITHTACQCMLDTTTTTSNNDDDNNHNNAHRDVGDAGIAC